MSNFYSKTSFLCNLCARAVLSTETPQWILLSD
uniref:Uncharacterized protein n=1 Tax=Rhizophora mucronata TaxID=61149 RepID=A0A2P2NSG1_RHIMU